MKTTFYYHDYIDVECSDTDYQLFEYHAYRGMDAALKKAARACGLELYMAASPDVHYVLTNKEEENEQVS